MRAARWCGLLLLGLSLAGNAATPVKTVDFSTGAWVDVDPSGHAHVTAMDRMSRLEDVPKLVSIAEDIKARLRVRIEGWQFVPASRDGVPLASRTHVYVSMQGADDGSGGLAVRILFAATGAELEERNMSGLVMAGMNSGEEGTVTIDIAYGTDGLVTAATVHDSKTFEKGQFTGHAGKDLRKGMLTAAKKWKFAPEQVGGQAVPGSGRIPIRFCLSDSCLNAAFDSDGSAGEPRFAANDPAVKLRSDVAGTSL